MNAAALMKHGIVFEKPSSSSSSSLVIIVIIIMNHGRHRPQKNKQLLSHAIKKKTE